jgi:ankyrin repeat protein
MADTTIYKIEKTNFPFLKQVPCKNKVPYWQLSVPGNNGTNFVQQAVRNIYCDSFTAEVTRNERTIRIDMMQMGLHEEYFRPELYNTFNLKQRGQKDTAPPNTAFILVFRKFVEKEIGVFFDSLFPLAFKSTKTQSQQWIIIQHNTHQEPDLKNVPKEFIYATAEYLGASMIVWFDVDERHRYDVLAKTTESVFKEICAEMPEAIQYTDDSRADSFFKIAKVRYGTLEQITKLKLDPAWEDPMKNSILHIALFNYDIKVFHFLAKKFPELINKRNIFGNTPIHQIPVLRERRYKTMEINWEELWKLPIDFSVKDERGVTCLESLVNEANAANAFKALIKNEKQWKEARKHHKRKEILTAVMHEYTKSYRDIETVVYFIEQGASIHHHKNKSLLNSALRAANADLAQKLLELGSKLTVEDILFTFESMNPACVRLLAKRPELSQCSSIQLSRIVEIVINMGLTDVLKYLVKRGCKAGLGGINQKAMLGTANLIAQMNRSTVMPLKFLCVDEISEATAKDDETGKILETYPEEIRTLFPKKELWRWVLLMDASDRDRQRRILNLYQAANSVKTKKGRVIYKVGSTEFCFSRDQTYWRIWLGNRI